MIGVASKPAHKVVLPLARSVSSALANRHLPETGTPPCTTEHANGVLYVSVLPSPPTIVRGEA